MEFPNFVYRARGRFQRQGGTYDYKHVTNQADLDDAIADGWYLSIQDAIDGVKYDQRETIGDDSAPTREELEEKANELGLKFDGRTSDRKLLEMINSSM